MTLRRTALTLGAVAGGLLTGTFLSAAVANADTFDYVVDPNFTSGLLTVTGIPPVYVDTTSYSVFDVDDTTVGTSTDPDVVGKFDGQYYTVTTEGGFSNDLIRVDLPFADSDDVPPTGSIFDTANLGNGFENVYTDLVGAGTGGANLITDTFDTPFGDFSVPTDFDVAAIITSLLGTTS
jgi:hypothetical protein